MADYKLVLPAMGEGVTEATITGWLKQVGDWVEEDESLVEVATDKVDSEVPSPVTGKVIEIKAQIDDVIPIDGLLAVIEVAGNEGEKVVVDSSQELNEPSTSVINDIMNPITAVSNGNGTQVSSTEENFYSPLVKSIIQEENITEQELSDIKGSGKEGRITKEDLLTYLEQKSVAAKVVSKPSKENVTGQVVQRKETIPNEKNSVTEHQVQSKRYESIQVKPGDEVLEMDRMRKLIAKHMVHSKQTSPHVTSVVETDMTAIVNWRNLHKEKFFEIHGEKLTFMPIIVQALVKAIRDFPMINISVNEDKIIKKRDVNIGIATALPNGNLIVPVVKNADQLNLTGLTKQLNNVTGRARENQLKPDEVIGGTYTITNIGTFGNVVGTPIINQPQVAIMAVGAIEKKPAVIETPNGDLIGIRHKMFLSHTYDHRVVDGALGGMFVKKVSDYLENFDIETEI